MSLLAVPKKSTMPSRGLVRDERAEVSTDDDVPARIPPRIEVLLDLFGGRQPCMQHTVEEIEGLQPNSGPSIFLPGVSLSC